MLKNNRFTGSIPYFISGFSGLKYLYPPTFHHRALSGNAFTEYEIMPLLQSFLYCQLLGVGSPMCIPSNISAVCAVGIGEKCAAWGFGRGDV